jgi:hypothetical protein
MSFPASGPLFGTLKKRPPAIAGRNESSGLDFEIVLYQRISGNGKPLGTDTRSRKVP